MTKSVLTHHQKFYITHSEDTNKEAVVELKIWQIDNPNYPDQIKYSLFCVDLQTKEIIIGFDNHHPKGHHLHILNDESYYFYTDQKTLIEDFFLHLKKGGYLI